MKKNNLLFVLAFMFLLIQSPSLFAQSMGEGSWNQFRGPNRLGSFDYELIWPENILRSTTPKGLGRIAGDVSHR